MTSLKLTAKDGVPLSKASKRPVVFFGPGPGFPIHHEAKKIQTALGLTSESDILILPEWRGCGTSKSTTPVSFELMTSDVLEIIAWAHETFESHVTVIGVSIGSTCVLTAAAQCPIGIHQVLALATDIDFAGNDEFIHKYLKDESSSNPALAAAVVKMGPSPVLTSNGFQLRAEWLIRLGVMQTGLTWYSSLWSTVTGLFWTYGLFGMLSSLQNMSRVQNLMLPAMAEFKLNVTKLEVPVVVVHGAEDVVSPVTFVETWFKSLDATDKRFLLLHGVRHMPHYECSIEIQKLL
ncbi:Alpha/Beta hydrolase protein [Obelidium mucronatum]|nr:Alpha/Beta hydrolase protein [Obelidium mucronatum]